MGPLTAIVATRSGLIEGLCLQRQAKKALLLHLQIKVIQWPVAAAQYHSVASSTKHLIQRSNSHILVVSLQVLLYAYMALFYWEDLDLLSRK